MIEERTHEYTNLGQKVFVTYKSKNGMYAIVATKKAGDELEEMIKEGYIFKGETIKRIPEPVVCMNRDELV